MMKPEMTSRTASRVVTMMDRDPLTAAMLTRTSKSTLQRHNGGCVYGQQLHELAQRKPEHSWERGRHRSSYQVSDDVLMKRSSVHAKIASRKRGGRTCLKGMKGPPLSWPYALLPRLLHPHSIDQSAAYPPAGSLLPCADTDIHQKAQVCHDGLSMQGCTGESTCRLCVRNRKCQNIDRTPFMLSS